MDLAAYYELWKPMLAGGADLAWWQEFFVKFYQAFLEADRWKQYIGGVGTTLVTTALALAIGIALGVLVARSALPTTSSAPVSTIPPWVRPMSWQRYMSPSSAALP